MTNLEAAARAIIHQRDHFAETGGYDLKEPSPAAEPGFGQDFDDWAADILETALASDAAAAAQTAEG